MQKYSEIQMLLPAGYFLEPVLLLPFALRLSVHPETPGLFRLPADKYFIAYVGLLIALQVPLISPTDLLRTVTSQFIDAFLPYYVFSRGLRAINSVPPFNHV